MTNSQDFSYIDAKIKVEDYETNILEKLHHEIDIKDEVNLDSEADKTLENESHKLNECSICEKKFYYKSNLRKHAIKNHNSVELCETFCLENDHFYAKPLLCSFCDFKCLVKNTFEVHVEAHTKKLQQEASNKRRKHLPKPTLIDEKIFACEMCDYKDSQIGRLMEHLKFHRSEFFFKCEFCDYKCWQKGNFKNHLRNHTGEKPYACEVCDCKYKTKSGLIYHMRTHTGEKPYACPHCDFKATILNNLKIHSRTHTGEKPYTCDICDYSCAYKGRLVLHIKTHTGEKPFLCSICGYKCLQGSNLTLHMRTHTGEKPHACTICDFKCTEKSNLKRHIRTHT